MCIHVMPLPTSLSLYSARFSKAAKLQQLPPRIYFARNILYFSLKCQKSSCIIFMNQTTFVTSNRTEQSEQKNNKQRTKWNSSCVFPRGETHGIGLLFYCNDSQCYCCCSCLIRFVRIFCIYFILLVWLGNSGISVFSVWIRRF